MGGSRCSYRNCTVRSGVNNIHIFHFPVYDKKRCHQWLANAQKFEYLNLKLSQLRNRVICQHHFKDECFMNYLKDKLMLSAIPTEDGPYCDSSTENTELQGAANVYSLFINDNEGDDKYVKKNNSSVIYADFLTNGDVWEKQSLNETIWNNKVLTNKPNSHRVNTKSIDVTQKDNFTENLLIRLPDAKIWPEDNATKMTEFENPIPSDIKYTAHDNIPEKVGDISSRNTETNKIKTSRICKDPNYEFNNLLVQNPPTAMQNEVPKDVSTNSDLNELLLNQENNNMLITLNDLNVTNNIVIEQITDLKWPYKQDDSMFCKNNITDFLQPTENQYSKTSTDHENVVEIPKEVPVEFEFVNNHDLKIEINDNFNFDEQHGNQSQENKRDKPKKPKIKILFEETITEPITITDKLEPVSPSMVINISNKKEKTNNQLNTKKRSNFKKVKNIENMHSTGHTIVNMGEDIQSSKIQEGQNSGNKEIIPKTSAFKHKISPERIAAIEKKRSFNKKLRDIIEICLEKLDEQDKTSENTTVALSPKPKDTNERVNSLKQNVGSYLSKQTELPNAHEYSMKYIEARMKKMEDILINKIEQNSQKIAELKEFIAPKKSAIKSTTTQTSINEESYKKQLYQEMSKFLSPNANSLVYEELFINKYAQKISNQPSPKRRKRR